MALGKTQYAQHGAGRKVIHQNHVELPVVVAGFGGKKQFTAVAAHIGNYGESALMSCAIGGNFKFWRGIAKKMMQAGEMVGVAPEELFEQWRHRGRNFCIKADPGYKNKPAVVAYAKIGALNGAGQKKLGGIAHRCWNAQFAGNDVCRACRDDAEDGPGGEVVLDSVNCTVATTGCNQALRLCRKSGGSLTGILDAGGVNYFAG